ncbi:hypothetical protein B0H13DRAFT_845339 [Mycena leptocephala]|nr:hypothetical protein B0H13DRAFT_845339 [Mycena leptocephala]
MVHFRRLHNRQDGLLDTPTAAGITAAVAQTGVATANSLVFNTAATGAIVDHGVSFAASATGTFTSTPSPTDVSDSDSSSPSPSPSAVASASSSEIPLGTVIGACLGALAACVAIIIVGLWLYRRGNKPRPRSPSNAHKGADKERAWAKMHDDDEDKWEGKEGKYQQNGLVSVGPMEKLTMFKKSTPSIRTAYTTTLDQDAPTVPHFDHPFAKYHPDLAKELAQEDGSDLGVPRPFLGRVEAIPPISWDGDTVGRDSFLSLGSNAPMSPGLNMAIPTPQLTSSEPHHWESAVVMDFDQNGDAPRGRASVVESETDGEPRRKSSNNPFFGSRMSTHSTHSRSRSQSRARSQSHSRTPSLTSPSKSSLPEPDPITMPVPPANAYTREEKGKYRAITPPSPTSSMAPSTITGHNPFSDPPMVPIVFKPEHVHKDSHDRAMQSLIAALGSTAADVEERLRVASMNPSVMSESAYTETDADDATLHQSWPVPPSRP